MTISRVIWTQDFDIITAGGGAQLTDRAFFLEGVRRGLEMGLATLSGGTDPFKVDPKGLLVIASNPTFCGTDFFDEMTKRGIPYIYFFHDYWPLCKYRLFFPMQEKCRKCYLKGRWLPVLSRARALVWLSPLHRASWLWACPELEEVPYIQVPSPVDPDSFFDLGKPRKGLLAIESLHPFKGREAVLEWAVEHPEVEVTFLGGNPIPGDLPLNCKDSGLIPHESMNEFMNDFEGLLHLPQNPMPFDRTVAEAYMAGGKILGNELVGALSWDWFHSREEMRDHCRRSPSSFWEKLEEIMDELPRV